MAHHPMYCSSTTMGRNMNEGKQEPPGPSTYKLHPSQEKLLPPLKTYGGCTGTGEDFCTQTRSDIEPLFLEYGVDMYFAGHEHNYESTFPVKRCTMNSTDCYIGKDFIEPQAPVHVTAGHGGTSSADSFGDNWGPWTRKQLGADTIGFCSLTGSEASSICGAGYGRVTVLNASRLTFEYVLNHNDTVWDSFTIQQSNHGKFD